MKFLIALVDKEGFYYVLVELNRSLKELVEKGVSDLSKSAFTSGTIRLDGTKVKAYTFKAHPDNPRDLETYGVLVDRVDQIYFERGNRLANYSDLFDDYVKMELLNEVNTRVPDFLIIGEGEYAFSTFGVNTEILDTKKLLSFYKKEEEEQIAKQQLQLNLTNGAGNTGQNT